MSAALDDRQTGGFRPASAEAYHVLAWIAWLVAAGVPAFMLRNPLYQVLILGASWLVYSTLGRNSPLGRSWGSFVRLGLFLFALTIPFTALANHQGQIILFRLPRQWPILGGPITLESILAGAVSGLSLLAILAVFAAFNAAVDHYQLLRATPASLFQAGVIVSIAVTFVPQMILSAGEIREAQRIRGHRFRRFRDLLPLVLPLLASALERAIQLAETMEARGFGQIFQPASRRRSLVNQAGTLAALVSLLAGLALVAYAPRLQAPGWIASGLGIGGLIALLWQQGRLVHRSRYRRTQWGWRDGVIACAGLAVLSAVVATRLASPQSLIYNPYPPSSLLPPFDPVAGSVLLLLALPALLASATPVHKRGGRARPQAIEPGPSASSGTEEAAPPMECPT